MKTTGRSMTGRQSWLRGGRTMRWKRRQRGQMVSNTTRLPLDRTLGGKPTQRKHDEKDGEEVDDEGRREERLTARMKTTDTNSGTMIPTAGDSTKPYTP